MGSVIARNTELVYDGETPVSVEESIIRFTSNGAIDTTFGSNGEYIFTRPFGNDTQFGTQFIYNAANGKAYFMTNDEDYNTLFLRRFNLPTELLSISENSSVAKVNLKQNPVREHLKLTQKLIEINIYSISGRKVVSTQNTDEVNVKALQSGTYILTGKSSNGHVTNIKFIKQ